jgi:hypothetical protein
LLPRLGSYATSGGKPLFLTCDVFKGFPSRARSVIVHDSPTGFCFLEQQREASARLAFGAQLPAAENEGGVFAENRDFNV